MTNPSRTPVNILESNDIVLSQIFAALHLDHHQIHHARVFETMLVAGLNDGDEDIAALGRFIAATRIAHAYLAIPHRPPAVAGVRGPDEAVVLRAFRTLAEQGLEVELLTAYEGDVFAFGGDLRAEILAISAVHPLRTSAIQALLDKGGDYGG